MATVVRAAYYRTAEAAEYLGFKPQTLRRWRCEGTGPEYSGTGSNTRYSIEDLDAWAKARTRKTKQLRAG